MGIDHSIPGSTIFESTLLGTGGGYGESQVVHLGNNQWVIVDSCIDPQTNYPLPLKYLERLGIDLSTDVKLIICTHWHDDHIKGISEVLKACESSKFSMALANDRKKFLRLVGLDHRKKKFEASISSTKEINDCLDLLADRRATFCQAIEDRLLISFNNKQINSKVFALSPSDYIMREFEGEISTLITEYGQNNRKIIIEKPNAKSVAIYLKVNQLHVILGSDLEVDEKSDKKGWMRVLNHSQVLENKSSLFKIPHHGSENGYHDQIWKDLIVSNPVSKMSPWNKNGKLPKKLMLKKVESKSDLAVITSTFNSKKSKPKARDRDISKIIKKFKPSMEEIKYSYGLIRCRANILNSNSIWCIETEGSAKVIDSELINDYPV